MARERKRVLSTLKCETCLTKSFQADRDPRSRGYRPLDSRRYAASLVNVAPFKPLSVLFGLLVVCCSCATTPPVQGSASEQPLLSIEYRDGGPAPVGFTMDFYTNGRVRYFSPWGRYHRADLSAKDRSALATVASPEQLGAIKRDLESRYKYRFACCDAREVGVEVPGVSTFGVPLDPDYTLPSGALSLVRFINRMGKRYFGHSYRIQIECPAP